MLSSTRHNSHLEINFSDPGDATSRDSQERTSEMTEIDFLHAGVAFGSSILSD